MLNLLAQIELEHPARLAGLLVLPLLAYFAWRSRTRHPSWRRWAWLLCRGSAVALLIVALAGITLRSHSSQRLVVLAVDVSRSVESGRGRAAEFLAAAEAMRGEHRVRVLPFADRPGPLNSDGRLESGGLDPLASDPAAAIRAAAAAVPADHVPQIVLLTDGLQTHGEMAAAALGAASPIDVVFLPPFGEPDACLAELTQAEFEEFTGRVTLECVVHSNHEGPARVEIQREERTVAERDLALLPGESRFRFITDAGEADAPQFRARVAAGWDTIPENNRRRTRVFPPQRPRVLLVQPHNPRSSDPPGGNAPQPPSDGAWLTSALSRSRAVVEVRPPDQLPADATRLDDYAAVVLSSVRPDQLSAPAAAALAKYVEAGRGGLIVAGGDETFGAAVYRDSWLERLAPVNAAEPTESQPSPLALLLVIDRSASMVDENRMELAKEAARQSIRLLEPHDQAGVMAFSDAPLWIAEIAPVGDRDRLLEQIGTLTPGGQTNMYQAVERAFLALAQTAADRRYMILLTDGIPAPGDYREIAQRMAEQGITLSTVSIGEGAEQDLLIEMARIAGGRHHHCDNPEDVPAILVRETQTATRDDRAESFTPLVLRRLPGLDAGSLPPMSAYALTNPKPEAEQLLMAAGRDPLLAWWRYGAGTVVALTAAADSSAMLAWADHPDHAAFWQLLIRHAARRSGPPQIRWESRRDGAWVTVTADFGVPSDEVSPAMPEFTLQSPDGGQRSLSARPAAPGRYQVRLPASDDGEYRVDVQATGSGAADAGGSFSWWNDYAAELLVRSADETALREIAEATGGRYNPPVEQLFAADGRTVERTTALWRPLVLAALLLFVLDVGLRRTSASER